MNYKHIVKGVFLSRPNRFIAQVLISGKEHTVHVKNTGRCKELLIPGCEVFLEKSLSPGRKTEYDLVTVRKNYTDGSSQLINMDSQAVNELAQEFLITSNLFGCDAVIKREVSFGTSRFDFYIEAGERKIFLEVKGVTLEKNGVAMFPDAPTDRGVKHIKELESSLASGYEAYILFIVQMKGISKLIPNDLTHKAFGDSLRNAAKNGVKVLAVDCDVSESTVIPDKYIDVEL